MLSTLIDFSALSYQTGVDKDLLGGLSIVCGLVVAKYATTGLYKGGKYLWTLPKRRRINKEKRRRAEVLGLPIRHSVKKFLEVPLTLNHWEYSSSGQNFRFNHQGKFWIFRCGRYNRTIGGREVYLEVKGELLKLNDREHSEVLRVVNKLHGLQAEKERKMFDHEVNTALKKVPDSSAVARGDTVYDQTGKPVGRVVNKLS